jgi:hypothetical protein
LYTHSVQAGSIDTRPFDKAQIWVVSPGTKLLASNNYQNEFYIIGKKGSSTQVTSANQIKTRLASKKEIARIKLAITETLHRASMKQHSASFLHTESSKIGNAKPHSKKVLALTKHKQRTNKTNIAANKHYYKSKKVILAGKKS